MFRKAVKYSGLLLREKKTLIQLNIPVPPFQKITTENELLALKSLGN